MYSSHGSRDPLWWIHREVTTPRRWIHRGGRLHIRITSWIFEKIRNPFYACLTGHEEEVWFKNPEEKLSWYCHQYHWGHPIYMYRQRQLSGIFLWTCSRYVSKSWQGGEILDRYKNAYVYIYIFRTSEQLLKRLTQFSGISQLDPLYRALWSEEIPLPPAPLQVKEPGIK